MRKTIYAVTLSCLLCLTACSSSDDFSSALVPEWAIPAQYSYASSFSDGVAVVQNTDGSFMFIDDSGNQLFNKSFYSITTRNGGDGMFTEYLPVVRETSNQAAYKIQRDGSPVPEPEYPIAMQENLIPHPYHIAKSENGLMGVVDIKEQWIVSPDYENIFYTSYGQIRILNGNDSGYLTENGELIFVDGVGTIENFIDGYAVVSVLSEHVSAWEPLYNFVDERGNFLLNTHLTDSKPILSENIITYSEDGLYGFMSMDGNVIIPPQYAYAGGFHEGLAAVTNDNGEIGYVDRNGTVMVPFRKGILGREFQDGLAAFTDTNGTEGLINTSGEWVINPGYHFCYYHEDAKAWELQRSEMSDTVDVFYPATGLVIKGIQLIQEITEDHIVAFKGERGVLITFADGKEKIQKFDWIAPFSGDFALASKDDKLGYIDSSGEWVYAPQFENANSFSEGLAAVCVDGQWGYIKNPRHIKTNKQENANESTQSIFSWHISEEGTAVITEVNGDIASEEDDACLFVPAELDGYPVKEISGFVMGDYPSTIVLPEGLEVIHTGAFSECDIERIIIPSTVELIEDSAFSYCPELIRIEVSDKNVHYQAVDGALYNKTCTELICCPEGVYSALDQYHIMNSVEIVRPGAFTGGQVSSVNLVFPDSTVQIMPGAFYFYDSVVDSISFPNDITIDDGVFSEIGKQINKIVVRGIPKAIAPNTFDEYMQGTLLVFNYGTDKEYSTNYSTHDELMEILYPKG